MTRVQPRTEHGPPKERPILFSSSMVRSILDGRKSQTRRIVKPQPPEDWRPEAVEFYHPAIDGDDGMMHDGPEIFGAYNEDWGVKCPYGGPGDRLWVRETWQHDAAESMHDPPYQTTACCFYQADESDSNTKPISGKWRPSIHMPRWESRLTLELTGVRVERVQDISAGDVWHEGVQIPCDSKTGNIIVQISGGPKPADYVPPRFFLQEERGQEWQDAFVRAHFAALWDTVNGKGAWERNDWCWVLSFRRVEA